MAAVRPSVAVCGQPGGLAGSPPRSGLPTVAPALGAGALGSFRGARWRLPSYPCWRWPWMISVWRAADARSWPSAPRAGGPRTPWIGAGRSALLHLGIRCRRRAAKLRAPDWCFGLLVGTFLGRHRESAGACGGRRAKQAGASAPGATGAEGRDKSWTKIYSGRQDGAGLSGAGPSYCQTRPVASAPSASDSARRVRLVTRGRARC